MNIDPTQILALMGVAMATALVTRRLALPYTVGLVGVGVVLALLRVDIQIPLTRDFIFDVILPPLLFEAALNLRWRELRRDSGLLAALAVFGTLIAAVFVALAMHALLHWPLPSALVFGALIAATDPVAVIALFKDIGLHGRLRTLVESESLFNDAAAAVLFSLALGYATATGDHAPTAGAAMWNLTYMVAGGALAGAVCGGAALLLIGRTGDHLIEAGITILAAYGAFFGAEHFAASGILATVIAGLMVGNIGLLRDDDKSVVSVRGREFILAFWDFIAFLSNSAIFPLIGLRVAQIAWSVAALPALGAAIFIVLISRAVTVYPISFAFMRSRQSVSAAEQHVLWWGGLRGALGLALALSLPATLPYRDQIVITTFVVATFSIVAQGLTMPVLLRALGLTDGVRKTSYPTR